MDRGVGWGVGEGLAFKITVCSAGFDIKLLLFVRCAQCDDVQNVFSLQECAL